MKFAFSNCTVLLLSALLVATVALGQANPDAELQSRLNAAAEAQQGGDPVVISQANRRLLAFALAQVAEIKLQEGEGAASADLFQKSLAFDEVPENHFRRAAALMIAEQFDAGIKETQALVERDPNDAAAWNLQGKLLTKKKEYQQAVDAFTKSLALQPDLEATYVMAADLIDLHQFDKADAIFRKLEQAGLEPARVHIMAGRAYEEANLPEQAAREYKAAVASDPKSRGHYFLGLMYLTRNGWEPTPQARQEFEAEIAVSPNDFFGNYFLGYLLSNEKDYDNSDRYLKVAAQARPEWPEAFLYLGLNAYGRGDSQSAQPYLRKAIELTGDDDARNNYQVRRAYFTLGRILIQSGKKEEGTKLVEKSKLMETKLLKDSRAQVLDQAAASPNGQKTPMSDDAGQRSNLTPEQKTQLAKVEKTLGTIVANAYNDLGTSEARRHDYATALEHFREAEHWNAETPGLMRNIGLAAFLAGNYSEAARALRPVAEHDSSDRRSQSMLAMSLYMVKDYPAAAKVFDGIADETMADPRMSFAWADTLAQVKNSQRASEVLGKLTEQQLPAPLMVRAGQLYAELGDRPHAEQCFQKARELDPSIEIPR